MSGGFFRGTSADQDTRFSNKQAKLLKSQKFPAELDQLVDTTKVKMDVIRPWIATRATELLGFEDEVLINFIYGLLDGKAVDGKAIQIQITGFMEKNTGKFMKELWILLLSAQMNASGVPQQFLDAKEEEMKKKKVETDRIALEIRSRREKEERERGKLTRVDGEAEYSNPKISVRETSQYSDGDREADGRHGRRPNNRLVRETSQYSDGDREADGRHGRRPNNRDGSKSRSASVSSQSERQSISPEMRIKSSRRRSISLSRRDRSPPRLSASPRRRPSPQRVHSPSRRGSLSRLSISPRHRFSPEIGRSPSRKSRRRSGSNPRHRSPSSPRRRSPRVRRRSPFLHRRSPSPARGKSPSPSRRRSPVRRRSPSPPRRRSPVHRRSPSPSRRRSPVRRRSPSPSRRRSPVRRRSPSPSRRRSPVRRRSPTPPRRRSPVRRRSPTPPRRRSPVRRRSPSPLRRRSPPPRSLKRRHSPSNHAANSQLSPRHRKRSRSPYGSRSPAYRDRRNLSRERDNIANGVESKWTHEKKSPSYYASVRDVAERPDSVSHRLPTSLMSPQRNTRDQSGNHDMLPIMPSEKSPEQSKSPIHAHKTTSRRDRSLSASPVKHTRERRRHFDSPESNGQDEPTNRAREESYEITRSLHRKGKDLPADKGLKKIHATDFSPEVYSTDKFESQSPSNRRNATTLELRKDNRERRDMELAVRHVRKLSPSPVAEDAPRKVKESFYSVDAREKHQATKQQAIPASSVNVEYDEQVIKHSGIGASRVSEDSRSHLKSEGNVESQDGRSKAKLDRSNLLDTISSDTETDAYTKKRKHSKPDRNKKHVGDDSESESEVDDRKMAKRRRKEEKRLRKEVRRRRREERHHRKSERRAGKLTTKSVNIGAPPSDMDNDLNGSDKSDGDSDTRMVSHSSDTEPESEQKKLEIELRKKALESLRAKKAISD